MRHRRGFTLIELLVAMSIMVALVGLTVSGVSAAIRRTRVEKAHADVMGLSNAVNAYHADTGLWPPDITEGDLGAALTKNDVYGGGAGNDPVFGPYLEFKEGNTQAGKLRDPWGNDYRCETPSGGPDAAPGQGGQHVNAGFAVTWSLGGDGSGIIGSWD